MVVLVITGQQLRRARERRGWTQEELASRLGVTFRSVGNWERGDVPANRQERIRQVLGGHLDEDPNQVSNPLAAYSNLALTSELLRRLDLADQGGSDAGNAEAEKSPVTPLGEAVAGLDSMPPLMTAEDYDLAARRVKGSGKIMQARDDAKRVGEESQDDGGWEPA